MESNLVERLLNSDGLEMLHKEASLNLDIDYNVVSQQGEIILHYYEEYTGEESAEGAGFTEVTVRAHPDSDRFERIVLEHEWAQEPMMGGGTRYTYCDGDITQEVTKIV